MRDDRDLIADLYKQRQQKKFRRDVYLDAFHRIKPHLQEPAGGWLYCWDVRQFDGDYCDDCKDVHDKYHTWRRAANAAGAVLRSVLAKGKAITEDRA